jgi:DNA-binding CsgD family transcriptional regulator
MPKLMGRSVECHTLDDLLASVHDGLSAVMVLRGEAGVGKTALLDYAVAAAPEMRTARIVAVESEIELGFSALHQLLIPFLDDVDGLPDPQRHALGTAFGLEPGVLPDQFLIGLASLTLISQAADERPILCVIDDAQWLDRSSAVAIGFLARRLFADRVGLLLAVRDGEARLPELAGLPELSLTGLSDDAAGMLLDEIAAGSLDATVRRRLITEASGSPLALVELARGLSVEELAGATPLRDPLSLPGRLEEIFVARVRSLPAQAQMLLLLAAAEPSGELELLRAAARQLGIELDDLGMGVEQQLELGPPVRFRHPLMRSAAYQSASAADRRRAHAALAAASDPDADPDRRAWHLAAACVGSDEEIAATLEQAAGRARSRAGWSSAAKLLERAAEVTPDRDRRSDRLLASARARLSARDPRAAEALLTRAKRDHENVAADGELLKLEGTIQLALGSPSSASELLLRSARLVEAGDPRSARDTLYEAFEAAHLADSFARDSLAEILQTARALSAPEQARATVGDRLLGGFAALDAGDGAAGVGFLRRALSFLAEEEPSSDSSLRFLPLGWTAASEVYDDRSWGAISSRWVREARARAPAALLPLTLGRAPYFDVITGRFAAAERGFAEARELALATGRANGSGSYSSAELTALAWQGREADLRDAADAVAEELTRLGRGLGLRMVQLARTVLALGLGRYREALRAASSADRGDSLITLNVEPELIEAAVRCGERAVAEDAYKRFARLAEACDTDWAQGLLLRSRAQLSASEDAEELYRAAIEHLERSLIVPQLARSHLLFGEWLRRQRRRRDAREQLRTAFEMLDAIGADAFAERARIELLATGEQARKRTPDSRDQLTAQESRVARLASEGASNQEIAAQLFISPATVGYHLTKTFRKLGVANRTSLARALAELESGPE